MGKKRTFSEYIDYYYYYKFPNSNFTILKFFNNKKVLVSDNLGLFVVNKNDFLSGKVPSILTCINKIEYLEKKYILKNKTHFVKVIDYKRSRVFVEDKYGKYNMSLTSFLKGCYPSIENCIDKTECFLKKAQEIHGDKYDYSLVQYINATNKVKIICPIHNVFEQSPEKHLQKRGCRKCKYENVSNWSYSNWEKKGKNSKNFDSFKVYIIKCWNNEEEFYKIGKTFLTIQNRFNNNIFPYNYTVIDFKKGSAQEISELEKQLQKQNKKHKYIPKLKFGGMHECFLSINT